MIRREEQHAVRAHIAELREPFESTPRGRKRSANDGRQRRRPPEQVDAGAEREQTLLEVGTRERDGCFELRPRRFPHRIRRQGVDPFQCAQSRLYLSGRRMHGQHFPDKENEGIAGWGR